MLHITTTLQQTPLNSGWICSHVSFTLEYDIKGFGN